MMTYRRSVGFSLIEVMIAVVVLSFGLLALAALQSGLFRAGSETKARANATAIAQKALEDARTFAYVVAPTGYTSATYGDIATASLTPTTMAGVTYKGCRQVKRYVYDAATSRFVAQNTVTFGASVSSGAVSVTCSSTSMGAAVDPTTPEFKQVTVAVAWPGDTGQVKSVELTDTVASVSPSDSVMVLKTPTNGMAGPSVWIKPPSETGVVPIAIGSDAAGQDIAAASSNPKPEQFVNDVSSVTTFNVQTFTGDQATGEVLLNRQLAVAAASCVCSDDGAVSTSVNPAYAPTVWNGKQLAYMEPDPIVGKKIGSAIVSNSDSEITALCTACCRDHHDAASSLQPIQVDPYRSHTGANGDHQHYGYGKSGNAYNISAGLLPVNSGEYEEACRLIRVNGRMRVGVDAMQNHLAVTPLNSGSTGFQNSTFVADYSAFVAGYIADALGSIPAGYPSPTAKLPAPTSARLSQHASVVSPSQIDLSSPTQRKLVDFALYVDYLNQDTLDAYNCAVAHNNTGACQGFGFRNALEYIPFYAVNVANLGSWNSALPSVADVVNATYTNQGNLAADGGIVTAGSSGSSTPVSVAEEINNSNSGLTATAPVDLDDALSTSFVNDSQAFLKTSGGSSGNTNKLLIGVASTSTISLKSIGVAGGASACSFRNQTLLWTCTFNSPGSITVQFSNFTTATRAGVVSDRKICYPSDSRVVSTSSTNTGTTSETFSITLGTLAAVDYRMNINIMDETSTCPTGTNAATLTP